MRVVAGKYRGKNLLSPKDESVRPTTTRIKETLFNVLQGYIQGAVVLDLFAGSGALGIECISRGASEVTFVDRSKDSISLVYQNLKGIEGNYKVVNSDFSSALRSSFVSGKQYDVIFLDPPYATNLGELAIEIIFELNLLKEDGIIIFEHGSEKTFDIGNPAYKVRTKKMGTVTAEFITKKRIALMTGSFDPFTKGHEALLCEALCIYDEVVVACLINPDKKYAFNDAQRLAICQNVCQNYRGASAVLSLKYAVEVAKEVGACALVRGIRSEKDEQYEREMAEFNKNLGVDTRFITLDVYNDISSTTVREEIARGDYRNLPASAIALITSDDFANLK